MLVFCNREDLFEIIDVKFIYWFFFLISVFFIIIDLNKDIIGLIGICWFVFIDIYFMVYNLIYI